MKTRRPKGESRAFPRAFLAFDTCEASQSVHSNPLIRALIEHLDVLFMRVLNCLQPTYQIMVSLSHGALGRMVMTCESSCTLWHHHDLI